jgi:hypothetical protein
VGVVGSTQSGLPAFDATTGSRQTKQLSVLKPSP